MQNPFYTNILDIYDLYINGLKVTISTGARAPLFA